jgi:glyoxylase I family protein
MKPFPAVTHVALTVRNLAAFGCADRAELKKWALRLDELSIEHGEIKDAHYGSAVSFRDPDGIALEFFAPPG